MLIGNVKLDLKYYSGEDLYSDGSVEDRLLELVKNINSPEEIYEILNDSSEWPIYYHLSPERRNIIEWFPFNKESRILEIGAGCGAITSGLLRENNHVTCIELSKKRSLINAYRNRDSNNLEIIVGDFNNIEFKEKYDYITLIGVLEYAGVYSRDEEGHKSFLTNIKSILKEEGQLIIAIENKLGLKYWCGYPEDHTGGMFDSVENYISINSKVKTFSKEELESLLRKVGFSEIEFMYPYPDYKFPNKIYSNDYLPKEQELERILNLDNNRIELFDYKQALNNIIQENIFDKFSNSFLVICK